MESITFIRGKKITDSLDIGEFRAVADDIISLFKHPSTSQGMFGKMSVAANKVFEATNKWALMFVLDLEKTDADMPDRFLIDYLPAKYFEHVVIEPLQDMEKRKFVGNMSADLGEVLTFHKRFKVDMYIKEEYTERFGKIRDEIDSAIQNV